MVVTQKPYVEPMTLKVNAYEHLIKNNHIDCDFNTFCEGVEVFQTPHGVYIELYAHTSQHKQSIMMNRLLNVTAEETTGYKNVIDWWLQQKEGVTYIKDLDVYLVFNNSSIKYKP